MADNFFRKEMRGALVGVQRSVLYRRTRRVRLAMRKFGLLLLLRLIIRHLAWQKNTPDVFAEFALTRIKVCAREMKYFLS